MRRSLILALVVLLSGCPKHITGAFNTPAPYPVPVVGYKVLRGTGPTNMEPIFTVQTPSFIDTTAQPGVTYYYTIVAVYADGSEAAPSNIACGTMNAGQVQCGP